MGKGGRGENFPPSWNDDTEEMTQHEGGGEKTPYKSKGKA